MATLVAGIQYGLSSQFNVHENKTLIFVKLTDSASQAIDDYLLNPNKLDYKPTIQFLGNKGQLYFPYSNHLKLKEASGFIFTLSGNKDIEGSQGGFDCVQQTGPRSLESFGTLPFKMRIQANDDVYERTKHRMAAVEENNKTKCTRMIKPNTIDLGKKTSSKGCNKTISTLNNISSSISSRNEILNNFNDFSCKPLLTNELNIDIPAPGSKLSQIQIKQKTNEIVRRSIKERLIHLLALRPFKKPELYNRVSKEGVKEKEKNAIPMLLNQIAYIRDNTYHLHRWVWNDVQEDWPFYCEQEKAILKRRKPQNLTPPGSSDSCSSASGQSPNSTYPGSPTLIIASPSNILGSKREGGSSNFDETNSMNFKRQRKSHRYKNLPSIESTLQVSLGYTSEKIQNKDNITNMISKEEKLDNDVGFLTAKTSVHLDSGDYSKSYTTICSAEQRSQYKAEFNAFYEEYRALHLETVKISDQFKQMEEQLKKEFESQNTNKYEAIKKEILQKYKKSKNVHDRFNNLHNKLGYIKKLVTEYDLQSSQQTYRKEILSNENDQILQSKEREVRCLVGKIPQRVLTAHSYTITRIS